MRDNPSASKRNRSVFPRKTLISRIRDESEIEKYMLSDKLLDQIVRKVFEVMHEIIVENDRVELANFGTLTKKLVKGKIVAHPLSGSEHVAPPHYRVNFTPSSKLKKALKEKALEEVRKV